jgi:hypothetical protein
VSNNFHLENIFAVMCRLAGADYTKVDRTKKRWFMQHSWDEKTQKQFRDFLADYIHKMLGAQQELYSSKYMRKVECKNAAEMFVLNYGWKIN